MLTFVLLLFTFSASLEPSKNIRIYTGTRVFQQNTFILRLSRLLHTIIHCEMSSKIDEEIKLGVWSKLTDS